MRADRQTDRPTDILITMLLIPPGRGRGKVTSIQQTKYEDDCYADVTVTTVSRERYNAIVNSKVNIYGRHVRPSG